MAIVPIIPSRGLLVSMAIREDHGFLIPYYPQKIIPNGYTDEQREERLKELNEMYSRVICFGKPLNNNQVELPNQITENISQTMFLTLGHKVTCKQVYEEIIGDGFYRPSLEEKYSSFKIFS